MWGMRADPRLRSQVGTRLRDKRSAVRFCFDGIKRTDNFDRHWYLICLIAATRVHMIGSEDLRVLSQATTLVLSEYRTMRCFGYLLAKSCIATKAARSSNRATGTWGYDSQPGHRQMNGWRSLFGNEKYSRPWTPPMPQEVEASTNMGVNTAGYLLRMYVKDSPRFRCNTLCQIRNAVRVNGGMTI